MVSALTPCGPHRIDCAVHLSSGYSRLLLTFWSLFVWVCFVWLKRKFVWFALSLQARY